MMVGRSLVRIVERMRGHRDSRSTSFWIVYHGNVEDRE